MSGRWKVKVPWLSLLLAAVICVPAHGQTKDKDIFAGVPATLRASLMERLKLLVEYQRTQQWEKQYELLSVSLTQGQSKEDYAKRNRHWYTEVVPDDLILGFTPKATTTHESSAEAGWWTIYGCAKLRRKGHVGELYASVDAHRERSDWYFSTVGVITPVDGPPQRCPYLDSAQSQRIVKDGVYDQMVTIKGHVEILNNPELGRTAGSGEYLVFQRDACGDCLVGTYADANGDYKIRVGRGRYKLIVYNPSPPTYDMIAADQPRYVDASPKLQDTTFDIKLIVPSTR